MSLIGVMPTLPSNLTSIPIQPGNPTSDTIKANLRIHSRYIRDILAPSLSRTGGTLTDVQLATLKFIFASISAVPMTIEYLQYSRIEKALTVIASGGGAWPADASLMAEALLTSWEDRVGPLKNIRADLWGKGSRLEGCRKLMDRDEEGPAPERRGSAWSVEYSEGAPQAYGYGDLGFEVGAWWLKPAAAFRDGIIDERHHSITADENGAYAILMEGNSESPGITEPKVKPGSKYAGLEKWIHAVASVERNTTRFTPTPGDPGIVQLRKEILTGNAVRVLRLAKLKSALAPRVGLRYDGLYRVMGYSVKLTTAKGRDQWVYTFQLARQVDPPQDSIDKALKHPTADEMDDWKDYRRAKANAKGTNLLSLRWGESYQDKKRKPDSGYFSLSSEWGQNLLRGELELSQEVVRTPIS